MPTEKRQNLRQAFRDSPAAIVRVEPDLANCYAAIFSNADDVGDVRSTSMPNSHGYLGLRKVHAEFIRAALMRL
jgi:hypothetical protein